MNGCTLFASLLIRNRATLGGNLALQRHLSAIQRLCCLRSTCTCAFVSRNGERTPAVE